MVTNERQYMLAVATKARLEDSLVRLDATPSELDPAAVAVIRAGIEAQRDDLAAQLKQYEDLRKGVVRGTTISGLDEVPAALVQARIVAHLTQRDLADRIEIHEQQIQQYEANGYSGTSWARLCEVARALNVVVTGSITFAREDDASPAAPEIPQVESSAAVLPGEVAVQSTYARAPTGATLEIGRESAPPPRRRRHSPADDA